MAKPSLNLSAIFAEDETPEPAKNPTTPPAPKKTAAPQPTTKKPAPSETAQATEPVVEETHPEHAHAPAITVEDHPEDSAPEPAAVPHAQPAPVPASTVGEGASISDVLARARAAQATAGQTPQRIPMRTQSMYPPLGKAEAFRSMARELGITNGALAMKAVTDHLVDLEELMAGPSLVPGYRPPRRSPRDRNAISLRLTENDYETLVELHNAWPGCNSVNDLLSTAVDMLLP